MLLPKMRNETEDKDKAARLVTGTQKPARQDVPIWAQFPNVYRPICVSFASGEHVQTRKNAPHLNSHQLSYSGISKIYFFCALRRWRRNNNRACARAERRVCLPQAVPTHGDTLKRGHRTSCAGRVTRAKFLIWAGLRTAVMG